MKSFKTMILMSFLVFVLTACGNDKTVADKNNGDEYSQEDITKDEDDLQEDIIEEEEEVIIESDSLPEFWHGEWVCVYSEANYFEEEETIFVKDFDNAVLYTPNEDYGLGGDNRWFFYDEQTETIDIYNEPPPFVEGGWIRESFEIKKQSEDEIVMTRKNVGQEVRFEKSK